MYNNDDFDNKLKNTTKNIVQKTVANISRKIARKGTKLAGKTAKFIGKQLAKIMLELTKLIINLIIKFIAAFGIWGIVAILIFFVCFFVIDLSVNSRGTQKNYQLEDVTQSNPMEKVESELGNYYTANGLSYNNKLILAFYTYFTKNSYSILIDDDETLYKPTDDKIVKENITDKYKRESAFELNVNTLWSLDEFLNNNEFRYPEQFIKPVPYKYENGTFELIPITKNGILNIESQKYNPYTNLPVEKEREVGLWDYGFGSVIHYSSFEEWEKGSGSLYSYEQYDSKTDSYVTVYLTPEERENAQTREQIVKAPHKVWLIDKAVGAFGHINANISYEERLTDKPWIYVEEVTKDVSVPVPCPENDKDTQDNIETKTCYEEIEVTLKYTYQGFITEKTAVFTDMDYSGLTGIQYYNDYFHNYHIKIPTGIMKTFDYEGRTGESEDTLLKLLETDNPDIKSGEAGEINNSNIDIGIGTNAESQNVANATQHIQLFEKYGEMYGVDPYLLIAKAAQESSGLHDKYIPPKHNGPAIGLMQIEKPGEVTKTITAYNQNTKQTESISICRVNSNNLSGCTNVSNLENNIKAGAMIMSARAKDNNYNLLIALQAYNYGIGGINATIKKYLEEQGKSTDNNTILSVKNNLEDTGWLNYRTWVHNNPQIWNPSWKYDTYGDDLYLEHVLRYYSTSLGSSPWIKDENGNLYTIGKDISLGSNGLGTSNILSNKFSAFINGLKSIWDSFIDSFNDLFPKYKAEFPPERWDYYNYKTQYRETNEILATILSFNEGKMLLYYGDITDEMWIEKFKYLFSTALSESMKNINNENISLNIGMKLFPDGFSAPLENMDNIIKKFGIDELGNLHTGIDIGAVEGSNVYSVALGEVIKISTEAEGPTIFIKHDNNIITKYSNLSNINVKIGEVVTKGQIIGKTGTGGENNLIGLHFEIIKDGERIDSSFLLMQGGVSSGVPPQYTYEEIKNIFQEAEKHIGKPYLWGASGPDKFDCSGFVSYVFKQLGYIDGRYTVSGLEQYALKNMEGSVYVFQNWDLLQAGDIVTKVSRASDSGKHIIIYAGKNDDGTYKYIDASGDGIPVGYHNGKGFSGFKYGLRFRNK